MKRVLLNQKTIKKQFLKLIEIESMQFQCPLESSKLQTRWDDYPLTSRALKAPGTGVLWSSCGEPLNGALVGNPGPIFAPERNPKEPIHLPAPLSAVPVSFTLSSACHYFLGSCFLLKYWSKFLWNFCLTISVNYKNYFLVLNFKNSVSHCSHRIREASYIVLSSMAVCLVWVWPVVHIQSIVAYPLNFDE